VKRLRYLIAALMVVIASSSMTVAATLGDLERQLKEIQMQIENLKLEKQEQDRRMKEIETAQKEKAMKEAEALQEQAKRGAEQERKTGILAEELEAIKSRFILPETVEYKSLYGLGPAASKVYQVPRGLSLGGYGETNLRLFVDNDTDKDKNVFDFVRFVTYIGYKFTDRIILNSEIEFEHATTSSTVSTSGGSVSVEFAYLDFLLLDPLNVRAGLVLIPMGFINELHEPTTFLGNIRPEVEQRIIPTTWRENGAGFFGTLLPGLEYRTYVVNSLNAKGFSSASDRAARQLGNRAFAEDFAWTGRLDYTPIPGLLVGGSFFWGNTGQDQQFAGQKIDAPFTLYEFHGQYRYRGLQFRALFAQGHIGDAAILSQDLVSRGQAANGPISSRIVGGYVEAGYDILPLFLPETTQSLSPFVRFERFDTQADVPAGFTAAKVNDVALYTLGLSYKPIPNVVLKLDYRNFNPEAGQIADEVNIGFGFIF
jgi:phosphoenolpyruvate synthase/pyruvate phosphate dikinase